MLSRAPTQVQVLGSGMGKLRVQSAVRVLLGWAAPLAVASTLPASLGELLSPALLGLMSHQNQQGRGSSGPSGA